MQHVFRHFKGNVVAYLALFVALGGTGYAALRLPSGSVGTAQLKNHSVTPIKFDRSSIGGYVRFWARVSAGGKLIASRPKARVIGWSLPPSTYAGGQLRWPEASSKNCFTLATAETFPFAGIASALTVTGNRQIGTQVRVGLSAPVPVNIAVICP